MGRRWRSEWVDGQARATCSICGFPRRFPDELVLGSDNVFRCEKCLETPVMETDKLLAAFRATQEEILKPIGLMPDQDTSPTLAEYAADRVISLFTGWTPSTTFTETFDIVPGGVGSSWTTGGTGTVSASGGIATLSCTAGQTRFIDAGSFTVASYPTARWYAAFRFAITTTPDTRTTIAMGFYTSDAISPPVYVGAIGNPLYSFGRSAGLFDAASEFTTIIHTDDDVHIAELWGTGDGYIRASIDQGPSMAIGCGPNQSSLTLTASILLGVLSAGATQTINLYDAVYKK